MKFKMDTIENLRHWTKVRNSNPVNSSEFRIAHAQVEKYTAMKRLELRDYKEALDKAKNEIYMKRNKKIYWHLIPIIGLMAPFTHRVQFDENNPFSNNFMNTDDTKDPFLFMCVQLLGTLFIFLLILLFS